VAGGVDIHSDRRNEQCAFWSFSLVDWSCIIYLVLLGTDVSAYCFFFCISSAFSQLCLQTGIYSQLFVGFKCPR
jgi:hypothetical protein